MNGFQPFGPLQKHIGRRSMSGDSAHSAAVTEPILSEASLQTPAAEIIQTPGFFVETPASLSSSVKVLVISNDSAVCESARASLEEDDRQVLVTSDPWVGIDLIREHSPDLILLDIELPYDRAVRWHQALQQNESFRQIPLICTRVELMAGADGTDPFQRPMDYLPKPFDPAALWARVGALLESVRLRESLAERTGHLYELYNFAVDLNALRSVEEALAAIGQMAARLTRSRRVSILFPEENGKRLRVAWSMGPSEDPAAQSPLQAGGTVAAHLVVPNGRVRTDITQGRLPNPNHSPTPIGTSPPTVSVPMSTGEKEDPVAILSVADRVGGGTYTQEEIQFLHCVAGTGAVALATQLERHRLDLARDATVLGLAKLAEYRDPSTGQHLERVTQYCRLLAQALAQQPKYSRVITQTFIEDLCRSAPLHDIGKVAIPDSILLKPASLTPAEWALMQKHVAFGADILEAIVRKVEQSSFLGVATDLVRYHHERWDGTGYLEGLAGEQIPLAARIMAVADVYDAIRSKRVYSAEQPHGQVASLLIAGAGTQFDPDVVTAFRQKEAIFEATSAFFVS